MALAVPGTAGFVGEFSVLLSLWDMGPLPALVAGFTLILSAAYMLRFIQKVIFGKASGSYDNGPRTSGLEGASIGIMAVLLLVFGFHPAFVTDSLHLFDEETVEQMNDAGKAADGEEAAETDEDADEDELPQAMTPDEIAQLDSSLKANGFTDEERGKFSTLLDSGFTDTFRWLYPEQVTYSWWSYSFQARQKNAGWRIDYFVVSDRLRPSIDDAKIHTDILGSDHCPVELTLK
jgi:NADH-quinone oxidoreductase subunit M